MNEQEYIIIGHRDGMTVYLAHEGHSHKWTADRNSAMVYTKHEVAKALADKYVGVVGPNN